MNQKKAKFLRRLAHLKYPEEEMRKRFPTQYDKIKDQLKKEFYRKVKQAYKRLNKADREEVSEAREII